MTDGSEGGDRAKFLRLTQPKNEGPVATHGVAKNAKVVGLKMIAHQSGEFLRDIAVHLIVFTVVIRGGVDIETGSTAEVIVKMPLEEINQAFTYMKEGKSIRSVITFE